MKTLVFLFLTSIIGTGAFLSALSSANPYPAQAVGFGVWILFIGWLIRRRQHNSKRKKREKMLNRWLYEQKEHRHY